MLSILYLNNCSETQTQFQLYVELSIEPQILKPT